MWSNFTKYTSRKLRGEVNKFIFWEEMSYELVTVCCRKEYVHSCENICDDQLLDSVREQTRGEQQSKHG